MRRRFAVCLGAAVVASLWMTGAALAEDGQTPDRGQQETEAQPEDAALPAETELARIEVPETRPEYSALDYVNIRDEKYKGLEVTLYPPADDSAEAKNAYQEELDRQIMTQLFALYPIDSFPEELMNYVAGNLIETYRQYSEMYGVDFSLFLQDNLQMDPERFADQVRTAARQTLTEELLLKAIAEKEGITVSDEEFETGCERYASDYGFDSADALKQAFDEPTIRISLLMDKTFDFLESEADLHLIIETETESEALTEAETAAEAEG